MNNQQAVVEQIVNNLAFEVEAVPKYKTVKTTSISKITPMNMKIRVRKKDEETAHHEDIPVPDETGRVPQKIRLVSSDQTIMAFDVFMEAEFEKKQKRKIHKHIFDMFRPGLCLGPTDDDEYAYMPSSSYSAKLTDPNVTTSSDGILRQNFTLTKHNYQDYTVSTQPGGHKWLFGKCKPGGCLDPPFSEDKYSYEPSTRSEHEQMESIVPKIDKLRVEDVENNAKSSETPIEQDIEDMKCNGRQSKGNAENVKNNGKRSSIFDGGLFNRKRKSNDKSTNTNSSDIKADKTDSILNLYQVESSVNSLSTHSNSIITYPPTTSSDSRVSADKTVRSRGPSEDKLRKSFNEHAEPYFIPPKGINRIEENKLDKKNNENRRPSDVTDSKETCKDSTKIPIPIPVPIPFPLFSKKKEPEPKLTSDPQEKETIVKISPSLLGLDPIVNSADGDVNRNDKVVSPNISSCDHQPESSEANNIQLKDNGIISDSNIQPDKSENKSTQQAEEKIESRPPQKSVPVPVPIPVPLNKLNRTPATDPSIHENDNVKIRDSKKPLQIKPPEIKEDEFIIPEDVTEDTFLGKNPKETESTAFILDSQQSEINDKEIESVPNNCFPTKIDSSGQDSNTAKDENNLTGIPIMEGDVQRKPIGDIITNEPSKPTTQNDIKNENVVFSKPYLEEWSDGYKIPDTDTEKNKHSLNEVATSDFQIISQFPPVVLQNENDSKIPETSNSNDIYQDNNALLIKDIDGKKDTSPSVTKNKIDTENIPESTGTHHINNALKIDDLISFDDGSIFQNNERLSIVTAPVIINKTESPRFEQVRHSFVNILSDPMVTGKKSQDGNVYAAQITSSFGMLDDNSKTHSTTSHELIGNKSVIYEFDEKSPSTSSLKKIEITDPSNKHDINCPNSGKSSSEIVKDPSFDLKNNLPNNDVSSMSALSSKPSTSTLKSALKKDIIYVALGFQSYVNDKNERIFRTFGAANEPKRFPNDSVTVIKSQIRLSSNEIRIPVDSDHDMCIQIKKPNTNQRVCISESGIANVFDTGRTKQKPSIQTSDGDIRRSDAKRYDKLVDSCVTDNNVIDLYEQELIPLQNIIKNLRDEIDVLATQQLTFRDKIYCPKKTPRLDHSNKNCFGCFRK